MAYVTSLYSPTTLLRNTKQKESLTPLKCRLLKHLYPGSLLSPVREVTDSVEASAVVLAQTADEACRYGEDAAQQEGRDGTGVLADALCKGIALEKTKLIELAKEGVDADHDSVGVGEQVS